MFAMLVVLLSVLLPIACQIVELDEFVDDLFALPIGNAFRDAGMQMSVNKQSLQLLDGLTHRVRLPQNIYTILVLFNHLPNATQVSFNIVQAFEGILFISVHLLTPSFSPTHWGGVENSIAQKDR